MFTRSDEQKRNMAYVRLFNLTLTFRKLAGIGLHGCFVDVTVQGRQSPG